MKKITDSFIKKIVRQSLNENYGLLNEEGGTYSYVLTKDYGKAPRILKKGTIITNLTIPECPEGGFCYSNLGMAESIRKNFSNKNLIIKGCDNKVVKMGVPTLPTSKIVDIKNLLMNELSESFINYETVKSQIQKLTDWPTFCAAYRESKKTQNMPLGFIGTSDFNTNRSNGGVGDYGIENDDQGDRNDYYSFIAILFDNSLEISKEGIEVWKQDLAKNAKILIDKKIEDKTKAEQAKKDEEERKKKIGGGSSSWVGFEAITEHPALGTNEVITTSEGDASVYSLRTGNPNYDKFLYGIIVRKDDGTVQPVKFRTDDKTNPIPIDIETDVPIKWAVGKDDVWKYNDVILSEDGKNIALTTNPNLENPFLQNESFNRKGFRYDLLTDAPNPTTTTTTTVVTPPVFELSLVKKSKGPDVKLIQQKLGIDDDSKFGTDTDTAVKAFQEKYKTKLPNATPGVVDQATFDLIKSLKGSGSRKVYSGAKTNYKVNDWIYVKPNKGLEGDLLAEKKYFKIISITPDRYTIVLDLPKDATDFAIDTVGGVTAKLVFGRDAEGESQTINISSDQDGSESEGGESEGGKGKRNQVSTGGTVDSETQRRRDIRKKETCDTLRQIKQYLNNTKGLSMTVNCKWNQEIRDQVMMALTGGSPAPIQEPGVNVQPVPVTDKLF